MSDITELATIAGGLPTSTDATPEATEAPVIEPNPNRVFFRPDYSRAINMLRTARKARYGAPWDAKDNPEAHGTVEAMAGTLASMFLADNPFFNVDKFMAATQLPAKPELPEGAFDAAEGTDDDVADVDELAALLADDDAEGTDA